MSHAFNLNPDIDVLNKYGYTFIQSFEIDSIWQEEQRLSLEAKVTALFDQYKLAQYQDTLFYIILVEHNHADQVFQHYHEVYNRHHRIKELAQLLLLIRPGQKHKPNALKLSSLTDVVKLTDPNLLNWIATLINQNIQDLNFKPAELGFEVMDFTDNSVSVEQASLDYSRIENYAEMKVRKPTIRERNKALVPFLLRILNYLNHETTLNKPEHIRFTDLQLNFLFDLAEILEWTDRLVIESEPKDYVSTLFLNTLRK